ncbi:MAG: hypothetical protein IPK32_11210 [Verrucomicrobiaceae bacterium]|nr:hypothetical protein [Verrucomicrobiaceae bacterium]
MKSVKKAEPCEHENSITKRLWKRLLRDAELKARPTHLDIEPWELDEQNEDGKIGRLDLRFLFSTGTLKPWPCFAIEAKRLHVTFPQAGFSSLVSEYVTSRTTKPVEDEQGMMCFISGRYSRGLRAGGMLGYVFDGEIEAARDAISAVIHLHRDKLRLAHGSVLSTSSIIPDDSGISESLHVLSDEVELFDSNRGRFTIYHLLVPV